MTRRPSAARNLALKAAAAAAAHDDHDEAEHETPRPDVDAEPAVPVVEVTAAAPEPEASAQAPAPAIAAEAAPEPTVQAAPRGKVGRPRGRRPVAAKQTIYLDEDRHDALVRIAEDRGRSIHSLILEGVDLVIGKPQAKGWQGRG